MCACVCVCLGLSVSDRRSLLPRRLLSPRKKKTKDLLHRTKLKVFLIKISLKKITYLLYFLTVVLKVKFYSKRYILFFCTCIDIWEWVWHIDLITSFFQLLDTRLDFNSFLIIFFSQNLLSFQLFLDEFWTHKKVCWQQSPLKAKP